MRIDAAKFWFRGFIPKTTIYSWEFHGYVYFT